MPGSRQRAAARAAATIVAPLGAALIAAGLAASAPAAVDKPVPEPSDQSPVAPAAPPAAALSRFFSLGVTSGDSISEMAGSAICRLLMRLSGEALLPRTESRRCSLAPAASVGEIFNQLAARRIAFAIVPAALAAAARDGSVPATVRPFAGVRAVLSLGAEPLNLVVARDSGITAVADLRGRRVNIGTPHSLGWELMQSLLAFHGVRAEDLAQATGMAPGRVAAALCTGDIDAFGLVVGGPAAAVARATDECGARLIPLSGEAVASVVAAVPGTTPVVIGKGTFATTTEAVPSVGVVALLVTSADEEEDNVYALTRTVMEHLNEIRGYHPALADLAQERMVRDGILVPLHPGALRYFRERGWMAGG